MKDKRSTALDGEGVGPEAGGMKSQNINIHEPSHLSERDSSVSCGTGGEEEEEEGRKKEGREETEGGRMGEGLPWQPDREPIKRQVRLSFPFVRIRRDALRGTAL